MHFQSSPDVGALSSWLSLLSSLSIHTSDLYTLKVIVLIYVTMLLGWECYENERWTFLSDFRFMFILSKWKLLSVSEEAIVQRTLTTITLNKTLSIPIWTIVVDCNVSF